MARDKSVIQRFASLSPLESDSCTARLHRSSCCKRTGLSVCPRTSRQAPYAGVHAGLYAAAQADPGEIRCATVMTSGNISDEPQVTDNKEVRAKLGGVADSALLDNRDIAHRIDDSVVRVMGGRARNLRRARGFAPTPIALQKLCGRPGSPGVRRRVEVHLLFDQGRRGHPVPASGGSRRCRHVSTTTRRTWSSIANFTATGRAGGRYTSRISVEQTGQGASFRRRACCTKFSIITPILRARWPRTAESGRCAGAGRGAGRGGIWRRRHPLGRRVPARRLS